MHTDTIRKTRFHYNGDASGDVIIVNTRATAGDPSFQHPEVTIPFEDLLEFVGRRLASQETARIESESGARFLKRRLG